MHVLDTVTSPLHLFTCNSKMYCTKS